MGKISAQKRSLLIFILLTLLWMGVIYAFSARNSTESAAFSSGLLKKLLSVFVHDWSELGAAGQRQLMNKLHHGFRKLGHFTEYTVLGMLLTATIRRLFIQNSRLTLPKAEIWLPAFLSLLYAVGDEVHQRFVAGRSAELRDVCIDFAGACCGIGLCCVISRCIRRRKYS